MRLFPALCLALSVVTTVATAQNPAPAATPAAQAVTRRDLADSYLLVDHIVAARGMPAASRARWNQDFDRTTLAFFGGDFPKVLRDMHDLAARMLGDSAAGSPTRQLLALRLRTAPRLATPQDSTVRLVLTVMYAGENEPARRLRIRVTEGDGRIVTEGQVVVPAGIAAGRDVEYVIPRAQLPQRNGRLTVTAELDGAATKLETPLYLFEQRADAVRAELERSAAEMPAGADAQALASLRARIALLRDVPGEGSTAQFLADPVALTAALMDETLALSTRRDPYRRTGDIWRVLETPNARVPFRLYVPPQARTSTSLPLVIALHGAGADENMFFEGYGAGRIRTLADSLGFIVLAPSTNDFARDPATLDTAIAVVARATAFDRSRVYMLGHSLGAGVTLRFAAQRRDVLRATALIAGAGAVPADQTVVPTLFIAAERDLVIPAARVRAAYDALQARGAPVEFVMSEGWGHTHVVGVELLRAVQYLLAR